MHGKHTHNKEIQVSIWSCTVVWVFSEDKQNRQRLSDSNQSGTCHPAIQINATETVGVLVHMLGGLVLRVANLVFRVAFRHCCGEGPNLFFDGVFPQQWWHPPGLPG